MSDDMIKIAREYDSAGRLMARGFVDEFNKLASNLELEKRGTALGGPIPAFGGSTGAMMGTGKGKGMCKGCGKPSRKCTCK